MNKKAKWIRYRLMLGEQCPDFRRSFEVSKKVVRAEACVTAVGVYDLYINGKRVGNGFMSPGWTSTYERVQYQRYDITEYIAEKNEISIVAGKGWALGNIGRFRRSVLDT